MFGLNKSLPKFCDLRGKVAIVTGAAKGMGKADVLKLSGAGAKVVLCDIDVPGCQEVADEIKNNGGESLVVKCDTSKKSDIDNVVAEAVKKFGKIDILVNNAGIYPFEPFLQMPEQNFEKVININLKGYFLMAQACANEMAKQKSGSIINIASVAMGQAGVGFPSLVHYCASKGAIVAMTEAMTLELAPYNIRVNAISPGAIETPMIDPLKADPKTMEGTLARIPMHRVGKPEEVSNLVLFLASDASSYMTGADVVIDGGWLAG